MKKQAGPCGVIVFKTYTKPSAAARAASMLVNRFAEGREALEMGRYGEAVRALSAAAASEESGSEVHRLLGLALARGGSLSSARQAFQRALEATASSGSQTVTVLRDFGAALRSWGLLDEALTKNRQARDLAAERQEPWHLPVLLTEEAEVYQHRGNHSRAQQLGLQALAAAEALREGWQRMEHGGVSLLEAEEGSIYSLLGRAEYSLGDVAESERLLQKAEGLQKALRPSHPDVVEAQVARALNRRDFGDLPGGLAKLRATEDALRRGPGEGPELGSVLDVEAIFLSEMGRDAEAAGASDEALKRLRGVFRDTDHWRVALAQDRRGTLLHKRGLVREALKEHERALEITLATVGKYHRRTAGIYNNLGLCHHDLGELAKASARYSDALEVDIAVTGAHGPNIGLQYGNIGMLRLQQGQPEEAVGLLAKAVAMLQEAGLPSEASPHLTPLVEDLAHARKVLAKKQQQMLLQQKRQQGRLSRPEEERLVV